MTGKKKRDASPPIGQKTLNKFLGQPPSKPRQQSLASAFKPRSDMATVHGDHNNAKVDMEVDGAADADQTYFSKKRPITISTSDNDEPHASTSASASKKAKLGAQVPPSPDVKPLPTPATSTAKDSVSTSTPTPVKLASPTPASSSSSAPKAANKSPTKKAVEKDEKPKASTKEKEKPKPAAGSFFAPRAKPTPPVDSGKGKGKAKVEADEDEDEDRKAKDDDEDEEEEEDDSEEEEGASTKLAEIFTSKAVGRTSVKWKAGEPVPYGALTATFDAISQTTKRLEISALLTTFLVEVIEKTPEDLLKAVYLCINRLCPDYEPLELGIGESILMKAIGESTGRTLAKVKEAYKKDGDLGKVAQDSRKTQATLFKPKPLTLVGVFKALTLIAKTSGKDSQARKVAEIKKLLAACVDSETKFLIRSLEGKLRIGLAERTVLTSLSHSIVKAGAVKDGKKWSKERLAKELEAGSEIVKQVFSEIPSYDLVIPALLEQGIHHLKEICYLTPGIPLKPMLAKPTKAITEVLDRFEGKRFTCEYKYDGERAQVHYLENGAIKVFSRNSEDMSVKYPDIVVQLPKCIKEGTKSFVIDAEAVAWDKETERLLPFQELSRRKRKDVKAEDITVKVHLFAFDLLYLNGKPLLGENLERRRELLHESLQPVEGEFAFATSDDATNVDDIQIFLDKSIKDGCEGLMVKMLEGEGASYEPSRRSIHWLKLKKDYLAGVGDSFDLVVVGADYGKGKRTNVYGAFYLACWDPEDEEYQLICKIGTGFSEEVLTSHYNFLKPLELAGKKAYVNKGGSKDPDIYFEPTMVWEVLAADLSLSPIYPAAKRQIVEAYLKQATAAPKGKAGKKGGGGDGGDDFW
ncbi:DNA ligase 1, partial [Phenoliferia sp. Uapishka_3]